MSRIQLTPPAGSLKASVTVPGSKSYTNRALIIAALTPGTSRLSSISMSSDSEAMIKALRMLGVTITEELFRRSRIPVIARPMIGGIIVGLVGVILGGLALAQASKANVTPPSLYDDPLDPALQGLLTTVWTIYFQIQAVTVAITTGIA